MKMCARLNQVLRADAEGRRRYMSCLNLHGWLTWAKGLEHEGMSEAVTHLDPGLVLGPRARIAGNARDPAECDNNGPIGLRRRLQPQPAVRRRSILHPSSLILPITHRSASPRSSAAQSSLTSVPPCSWAWGLSPRGYGARPAIPRTARDAVFAPARTAANSAPRSVGKITAMSNCQWLDPQTAAREGEPVPQGRSYALTSGLLEIAYDAGARAIVEGPAIFTVDAANGGSLFCGKLTMQVGKLDRAALENSQKAQNHPAPSPHAEAFCVRTHSAIIHDSGAVETKFGVEVDRSWVTYMHVFRGGVVIQSPGFKPCPVGAGTCVWTGAQA